MTCAWPCRLGGHRRLPAERPGLCSRTTTHRHRSARTRRRCRRHRRGRAWRLLTYPL